MSKERDLAIERLKIRAEMRSAHELEDSVVINQRASMRVEDKPKSLPPPLSWAAHFLNSIPAQHRVWPLLLMIILGAVGFALSKGWIK
jgi:hypothetical protein